MISPAQITFRNMEPSPAVATRIQTEAAKLDRYYDRITSCRVVIEAPHRHHKRGELFHLRIELRVPRADIVVQHEPSLRSTLAQEPEGSWQKHLEFDAPHKDIYVAIRDVFKATRRRLEDYTRQLRGDVKVHGRAPPARVAKLRSEGLDGLGSEG
jgi:ribosome-associated translation inhibitor RaiA